MYPVIVCFPVLSNKNMVQFQININTNISNKFECVNGEYLAKYISGGGAENHDQPSAFFFHIYRS